MFVAATHFKVDKSREMEYHSDNIGFSSKVILIPLDSRPACSDFLIDAGRIAGIEVIMPPSKLLDYFTIPGEADNIRKWLINEAPVADAIIISIDQLISGGLIASREHDLTDEDIDNIINDLIELRETVPNIPIYVFNILPRTQPQSSIENYQQRRALVAYSQLIGRTNAGLVADDEAIFEALNEVTSENLNAYLGKFKQCEQLSKRLITLTQAGILNRLVIGIDDGETFSIQNKILDNLSKFAYYSFHTEMVSFAHGADEIALTLLAEIVRRDKSRPLNVCVLYNNPETASTTLPFMAVTIESVVQEKLTQLRCQIVDTPKSADFTLYISVNDNLQDRHNLRKIKAESVEYISQLIEDGYKVALVDLGTHFDKEETILPLLINSSIPINSLIAYSGWNTASNSIGIALSQSLIAIDSDNLIDNLTFLNQRFLEDEFYLKDGIDTVNHALTKSGSYDNSYLDYGTEFEFATFVMRTVMSKKIADYKCSKSFELPVDFSGRKFCLKDFNVNISYPWPRTFEVRLKINNLTLSQVK